MLAIVDYGVGNLFSLGCSLKAIGEEVAVTGDEAVLAAADRIILPGVGAFGDAANALRASGLDRAVLRQAEAGKPLLGICLGMQLLFDRGFEYGEHPGLGLIPGEVAFLGEDLADKSLKIPHMGWNSLEIVKDDPLFKYFKSGEYVYYVHSFYARRALWGFPVTGTRPSPAWCGGETSGGPSSTRRSPGTRGCGCCGPLRNCKEGAPS